MDFTREPIIESVVTPKEGCKLVVRSSKAASQEEFFVDAVEVVSFGSSFFFRSLERPKSFLVPASDYEILEVRETRLVLKNVGLDKTIKIAGGREAKKETEETLAEPSPEKKRERRKTTRRRRTKTETTPAEPEVKEEAEKEKTPPPSGGSSSLLPPPSTLISETIARYKDNALFKDAFFLKEDEEIEGEATPEQAPQEGEEFPSVDIPQPEYGSFELTEEEEEEIYRQRVQRTSEPEEELPEQPEPEAEVPEVPDELIGEPIPTDESLEPNGNRTS